MDMVTLEPGLTAARSARRLAREACLAALVADEALIDTVVLLTSEMVTNAVMHGRSEPRLRVVVTAVLVRVEVGDENSRPPQPQPRDARALDGRGMGIVAELADTWGVTAEAYGKVVWVEIRR